MKRILFILPSLKSGGAERVISFIAQNIDRKKFSPMLLVLGFKGESVFSTENVQVTYLNKSKFSKSILGLLRVLNKERPDIVVSSTIHINQTLGIFSYIFPRVKFVVREASVTSVMMQFTKNKQIPHWLRNQLYNRLDLIICQSEDMKDELIKSYTIDLKKCHVIHNPITIPIADCNVQDSTREEINFITVGRLSAEKGHKRIITSLANINARFRYFIVGDGPLRNDLIKEVESNGLSDKVSIIKHSNNISDFLKISSFFLQGSYVEGFPNALLEALAHGVPCIAYDAPGGTREIIIDGENGYLVKDEIDLKLAIEKAVDRHWNRELIKSKTIERFSPQLIVEKYECALNSI
jgi:glycosyltransferase involved in cell wall biosynthesis